jgi:uncharacterized protein
MNAPLASAVYEGVVRHRRHAPRPHAFRYRVAMLYLDLDELDAVFARRWLWSTRRAAIGAFRRADYLGPPERPLADAVRDRVEAATGTRPAGPVRLLTHPRYFGFVFNPVSFYWCHDTAGRPTHVVAEITNTPWKERHAYVLAVADARRDGDAYAWDFPKAFHVSPFMAMARDYRWRLSPPDAALRVHMDVLAGSAREFDATLTLRRRPADGRGLARVLWRYPLMTVQVVAAIHWQALRLWLKRTPVHDHPRLRGTA